MPQTLSNTQQLLINTNSPLPMEFPDIAEIARNFAVMVRIQGPDPKGLKMRNHAFHHYQSGKTTISASGLLLPESLTDSPIVKHIRGSISTDGKSLSTPVAALVVTVASIVEPFLSLQDRESTITMQALPELIPGCQIDIMIESKNKVGEKLNDPDRGTPCWLPSTLLALVDIPASSVALQSLIEAPMGSAENGWEVGWSLASFNSDPHSFLDAHQTQVGRDIRSSLDGPRHFALSESSSPSHMAISATRIAFLRVASINCEDLPNLSVSPPHKRANRLLAMGSPFGVLSPGHFYNSISVGSIANCYPPNSSKSSLLMADIRCLPGMEGGPVFGEHAHLIGVLTRPLRQRAGGAEIQLVIPWEAIQTAQGNSLQNEPEKALKEVIYNKENLQTVGKACLTDSVDSSGSYNYYHWHQNSYCHPPLSVEKAMASVALVTIDGVWASGVLLNNQGLILTNAHLLEPWRFGKTTVMGGTAKTTLEALSIFSDKPVPPFHKGSDGQKESQILLPHMVNISDTSMSNEHSEYKVGSNYKSFKRIHIRLDHIDPSIWCNARVVYVSKGPLDIALLQLESIPNQLCPIIPDFTGPLTGSKAYVIGHGLFGPRCDLYPSVCSGVVARVIKAQKPLHSYESDALENTVEHLPVMLQTTAAVHPGGSGGAIVNSDGHMIGLVTSNARHGGGTVIPHLNFSIPCAALKPIFMFSKDTRDLSILQALDKPNEHLSSVWALMPPLSPRPGPSFPHLPQLPLEENNNKGKGSRFAKFIAERHPNMFPRPNQIVKAENVSNEIIRGRL